MYALTSNVVPFPVDDAARTRLTFEQIRYHVKALDRFPADDGDSTDHIFVRIRLIAEMLDSYANLVEGQFWNPSKRDEDYRAAEQHVFISYVREDSNRVNQLQRALEGADLRVWRDTADLWPGEDWRVKIRQAITENALVFIACFSHASRARGKSYQNEELTLAIEELRQRPPEKPWLIPVRFDDCQIPDRDIGAGRTLTWFQRADLFGDRYDEQSQRLIAAILRILGRHPTP